MRMSLTALLGTVAHTQSTGTGRPQRDKIIRLSFLIACLILFGSAQMSSTTDWQGLSPLKSTRTDVERTLGRPDEIIGKEIVAYRFPDRVVYFGFVSNPNCERQLPYTSWNVTSDTLTAIDVIFGAQPLIADTGIDLTKYKKIEAGGDLLDRYNYFNGDDSFVIEVGNNYLAGYHYRPGSRQKHLRCEANKQR
jgi:hypothetical protein